MATKVEFWRCDYCGRQFETEGRCKEHEKVCGANPSAENKSWSGKGTGETRFEDIEWNIKRP